jgi:hypothetical protein
MKDDKTLKLLKEAWEKIDSPSNPVIVSELANAADAWKKFLGFGKYEPKPQYYVCPKCGYNECSVTERHADTGMDCMEGRCTECGFSGEPKHFTLREYEDEYEEPEHPAGLRVVPLEKGMTVYHATSAEEEEFTDLNGPGWVSNSRDAVEFFKDWSGKEGRTRVLIYEVVVVPDLLEINNSQELQDLTEFFGYPGGMGSLSLAEEVCNAGYDGWIIPENYGYEQADIMLCDPMKFLEYKGEEDE